MELKFQNILSSPNGPFIKKLGGELAPTLLKIKIPKGKIQMNHLEGSKEPFNEQFWDSNILIF